MEGGSQIGGKMAEKVAEVNKQIANVEECQRQLEAARKELKALMDLRAKRAKMLEEEKKKAHVDREEAEAADQAAKERKAKALDDEIVAELKKVEAQLRKARQKEDPQGGVAPVPEEKSAAAVLSRPWLPVVTAIASAATAIASVAAVA